MEKKTTWQNLYRGGGYRKKVHAHSYSQAVCDAIEMFLCVIFTYMISESKCLIHSHKSLWSGSSRGYLYCLVHFYFRQRGGWLILLEDLYCLIHFYWRQFLVNLAWVQPLSNTSCGLEGPILVLLVQVAHESLLS